MKIAAAAGAVACTTLVLSPPVDALSDASFAWHMGEHLVLLFLVPLLIVLSQPFTAFRIVAGKRATAAFVRVTRPLHVLAHPALTFSLFVGYLWLLHFSPLYESALEHPLVHAGEHLLLVVVGTLFWLPVLAPPPLRPPAFPVRLFYLLLALPQGALLGFALGAARAPLYPHYAAVMGMQAALADQRNGAAVMWIGGGLAVLTAFLATFGVWAARESGTAREPLCL
ncbi:MAG TPA: cytochrome c oxidase assembly protein [Candidatus Baltobacteraceae bacterium]|nr:cytochrome c oxidase assembly protein [Candidatus Baltobacteraceae bacterium]